MTENLPRLAAALADRYAIERELGAGGMATVYLAEDLKHHRKVAVKVLRAELAAALGASRFSREIEIAARLQHPHILPLLDSGEADGFLYYVMPYVEGESLRERLARQGELPVHEAVRLLSEIVDALAHAHAHGVVHRDVKPDNVMLSGRHALVTDFGVAKAVSEATGRNQITTAGVALGTPAYMAPEQAAADPHLDHRVDIYAVGALGYELLTGRPPFVGRTPQEVLAAHVTQAPDAVDRYRPGMSPALVQVIMRCLAKRPADRWQSADELLAQLEPLMTPSGGTAPTAARLEPVRGPGRRTSLLVAGVVIIVAALVAVALLLPRNRGPSLTIGRAAQFTREPGLEVYPAISPDGRVVAYAAGNSARMRIFLRPVGGGRTVMLSNDSSAVETQPRWSPNGEQILFLSRGGVAVAPSFGGAARQIVSPSRNAPVVTAAWSPDGKEIAVIRGDSLLVFTANGSVGRVVAHGEEWHSCAWSPERAWLACVAGNAHYVEPGAFFGNLSPSAIIVIAASDGRIVPVTDSIGFNLSPQWSADGSRLYYVSNRDGPRDIYALSIRSDGRPRGHPARITTGLGVQSFSLDASDRRLVYAVYQEKANVWSLPIPERPPVSIEPATQVTTGNQIVEVAQVSGDGKWLYYDSDLNSNSDIYRMPLSGEPEQLTRDPADDFAPQPSPNGAEITFHSFRSGSRDVFVQSVSGGEAIQLTATPAQECCAVWSPDGTALAFADFRADGWIFVIRRDSTGRWGQPVRRVPGTIFLAWSPDGRYVALASGRAIRGVPSSERLETISPDSGGATAVYTVRDTINDPVVGSMRWSRDSKGLYFKSHDELGRASIWYQALSGGRPRLLVRFDDLSRPSFTGTFTTDDQHFYFTINDRQSDIWVAEVKPE